MRLKEGSKSIKFSMKDYTDKEVVFEKFKGQKVLLSFFRGASCPFCNLRINQLIKRYTEFEKMNINIITFFAATKEEISGYAGNQNAPFPIIPDPLLEYYKNYDVESSISGMFKAMLKPLSMFKEMTSGFFNMKKFLIIH